MPIISLIAAVDDSYGLGKNNQLLCHLPADLQHFKSLTLGKPIIMGRKTYESIGRPLPNRINIVLSKQELDITNVIIVDSIAKGLAVAQNAPEVMIIGGAGIYEQTIDIANRIYLTRIHHQFDADVFFPELDDSEWILVVKNTRNSDENNQFDLTFCTYERRNEVLAK